MVDSTETIYNLVYDYYEARIQMGVCRYKENLPSIPNIGEVFQMAPLTVRAAFTRLEKNGYIEIVPRKPARVAYRADEAQLRENAALYFVPRLKGILDFCQAGRLLIEPVWEYAQRSLDETAWSLLYERLRQSRTVELSISTRLHLYVFEALKNKLIVNFYWEALRFMRFPYLAGPDGHEERDLELLTDRKETGLLRDAFEGDFGNGIRRLIDFCSGAEKEYGLTDKEAVPFCWNIYWQRPQMCYTLVSRVILEIIKGTYPLGSRLPSMPEMSEQLKVSYRTLRRTLSILGGLGIIHLHQGKAAEVCMEIEAIDSSRPEIREGLRLYRESLQFMALTMRPVLLYTLENVTTQESDALTKEFVGMFSRRTCQRCFKTALDFIVKKCPAAAVRECYGRLTEFLVWGYPFTLQRLGTEKLQEEYAENVWKTAECLQKRDWKGFADHWKSIMEREYLKAQELNR